jgi:hypothetical protein
MMTKEQWDKLKLGDLVKHSLSPHMAYKVIDVYPDGTRIGYNSKSVGMPIMKMTNYREWSLIGNQESSE